MPPPAWLRAQQPEYPIDPSTGFPNQWPSVQWPWSKPLAMQAGWGHPQGRPPALDYDLFSVSDSLDGSSDWLPGAGSNYATHQGPPTEPRSVPYNEYLSNVIPDRAGRTLTYWAAAEALLHPGLRPMIEFDAPSVQTTIRRGMVLSDPYVAELRARGVIGPGTQTPAPAWTMQGWALNNLVQQRINAAPRPGQPGVMRGWG